MKRRESRRVRSIGEYQIPIVEAGGYTIAQWSPDEDHRGGPTQIHVMLDMSFAGPKAHLALRLKSREAVTTLIDVLTQHRDEVWPVS